MTIPENTIIAVGPVILEDNKILLIREQKEHGSGYFMLPGGKLDSMDEPLEDCCKREAKEELGIDIEILRPLSTLIMPRPDINDQKVILITYLAERIGEITPSEKTIEWGWYDIHQLPENVTPSIKETIYKYLEEPK